jgi:hypothetical protein
MSNEIADQVLTGTKDWYKRVIKHPLFPDSTRQEVVPLIEQASLLRDSDFDKLSIDASINPKRADLVLSMTGEIRGGDGLTIPDWVLPGREGIYFRRSYFTRHPEAAVRFFEDLFVLQLAGAMCVKQKLVWDEINDGSFILAPNSTKQEQLEALKKDKEHYFPGKGIVQTDRLMAILYGFSSHFIEEGNILYPQDPDNAVFDSTRKAALQAVLLSVSFGLKKESNPSPMRGFVSGVVALDDLYRLMPPAYYTEREGLAFILNLWKDKSNLEELQDIVKKLCTYTIDEFVDSLEDRELAYFSNSIQVNRRLRSAGILAARQIGESRINSQLN